MNLLHGFILCLDLIFISPVETELNQSGLFPLLIE